MANEPTAQIELTESPNPDGSDDFTHWKVVVRLPDGSAYRLPLHWAKLEIQPQGAPLLALKLPVHLMTVTTVGGRREIAVMTEPASREPLATSMSVSPIRATWPCEACAVAGARPGEWSLACPTCNAAVTLAKTAG